MLPPSGFNNQIKSIRVGDGIARVELYDSPLHNGAPHVVEAYEAASLGEFTDLATSIKIGELSCVGKVS